MPATRSGQKPTSKDDHAGQGAQRAGSKRKRPEHAKPKEVLAENGGKNSNKHDSEGKDEDLDEIKGERPPQKTAKTEDGKPTVQSSTIDEAKLEKLLAAYGALPLADYGVQEPEKATASTVLAHLLNAMLTSARISHGIANKTVKCLIEANYHDIETLEKVSWEEKTKVLTEGGYARYREKTATQLDELAQFIRDKYDGDLNKLRETAQDDPKKIRELIKEVKGIGDVGVNIFSDTVQAVWPCMAPYVDPRSDKTASEVGLGSDVQAMWTAVGKDPVKMARLCSALTTIRLEKKEKDFQN